MVGLDNNIKKQIASIYQSAEKESIEGQGDGWINLANFGPLLKSKGVDYKELGFDKLGALISMSALFETYSDTTKKVPVKYVRMKSISSRLMQHDNKRVAKEPVINEEEERIMKRLRLKNKFFIGQFSFDGERGHFKITDIRNTDFTKIEDKERGIRDLTIRFQSTKYFSKFAYYKFTWKLISKSPLSFGIDLDEDVTLVTSKDTIECINNCLSNYPLDAAKKITGSLDTLSKQLTQSGKEVFIYELLQNANDYPQRGLNNSMSPVDVDFHITSDFLTFQHTGAYFNAKNVAAICNINDGEKSDNVDAIGYKGIGFKTVFLDNDYVFLQTGTYTFRFDKSFSTSEDAPINTPWQIYPLWTEPSEVSSAVNRIFSIHPNDKYKVKFALKPRDRRILTDRTRKDNYIDLFSNVFESERVILFIPNIQKVSVFFDGMSTPPIIREKNNSNWCVSQALIDVIPENITERINDVLTNQDADKSDGYDKIPEKYLNFHKTTVKFACQKEGRKLLPVEDAILYCYLPAKRADWGFNFLMNTDMVPNGPRDDIEDIELNHEIAKIAGRQFFYWIKSLIESGEYELDSVFKLIPDFDECKKKKQYKEFIEEFQDEFETLIKEKEFIPVIDAEGNKHFERINNIIDDRTGLTKNNVMSDADFIQLMDMSEHSLPIQELRESECFMDLLYHYCPGEMDVDFDDIKKNCTDEDFQIWLKNADNNTKFIKHLLDNDKLRDFAKKTIFMEFGGDLYEADDLYYDFDSNCSGIAFLKTFVPHLCDHTRKSFDNEDSWKSFRNDYFKEFDAENIINDCIIDNEDAISLLKNIDNSVSFFKFVADNDVDLSDNKESLPYINEDDEVSTNYDGLLLFYNEDAYNTSKEKWLGDNVINILSHTYLEQDDSDALKTVFEQLGFSEFNKVSFITDMVSNNSDFRDSVNETIENDFDKSVAFFNYLFSSREELKDKTLLFKDYVVSCIDIDGDESYLCNDNLRYFDQGSYAGNSTFADNKDHEWISYTMMYSLNPKYFDTLNENDVKAVESFFRQQFGIKTFTDKSFFSDVVLKNKKTIYATLTDADKMKSFLTYLKRDADNIFDGSLSYNEVKDMPLLCSDGTVISERDKDVKLIAYNEDAYVLYEKDWCPTVFMVMSEEYSTGFTKEVQQLLKIENFDFNVALADIIDGESLQDNLEDTDNNVDFWRWIVKNYKNIADFNILKSVNLLDANEECCDGESLYISDIYQKDGIESIVKKYDENALFVSTSYLEDEANKEYWLKLFKKLGLKSDNKDILLNSILPNLDTLSEDSVVAIMSKHIKDLKEVWDERKPEIKKLQVRTKSGDYKTIDQTLIINIQEESVVEPFKYIELSNEIATDILEGNQELLLLIAKEFGNDMLISEKKVWAEKKITEYLDNIQEDEDRCDAIHVNFVRELAKIVVDYDISTDLMSRIKYRVKGDDIEYKNIDDITLGSAYSPICDFQANGIDALSYLSEIYIFESNKDTIKTFFKSQGLHHNMTKDDLKFLAIREFACYFWSYCFSRRLAEYESWVDDGLFKDLVCVPTEKSVQKPELLYAPHVAGYAVRAKAPNWEENVPCKIVVDSIENRDARELFERLNFRNALAFEDCLYYLARVSHPREDETHFRSIVINWMLSSPYQNEEMVDNYRNTPTAEWRNGKGKKKHISELYAIHPDAIQERNIFRGDEYVMQTSAFPSSTDSFVKVCEIFKIKCLTKDDFVATPIGKNDETANMVAILRPRLLVLSAIENPDKFQELYEKYNAKLSQFHFVVCEKIDLGYDTIHNDVERIYNDDNHLYYVSSWKHNRTFTKFCSRLKRLIGFDVYDNVCEDVLDENISVEECIDKYCSSLGYNEEFRAYLTSLDLSINVEIEDEPTMSLDEDYYKEVSEESEQPSVEEVKASSINSQIESDETKRVNQHTPQSNKAADTTSQYEETKVSNTANDSTEDGKQLDYQDIESSGENTSENQMPERHIANPSTSSVQTPVEEEENTNEYDSYEQIGEEYDAEEDSVEEVVDDIDEDNSREKSSKPQSSNKREDYNPDGGGYIGSVEKDEDYEPLGARPRSPQRRKIARPFTKEENERLRSHGTPLELESLPATDEELDILAQCGISPEQISDTNYLAQLRLYSNLKKYWDEEPEESLEDFIRNADDVTTHVMKSGKYIHTCSAARGVMYISPSVWNKMLDDKWAICVYLDGQGKNFHRIDTKEDFLKLVEKDDVVIKITGKEKVDVVNALYSDILKNVKGTAYTLIRVASRTNMDAVFAHYVGAMAEAEDGNEDENEYGD